MGHREDLYIPVVQAHLEAQLGQPLCRLDELSDSGPSHDFETVEGITPTIVVEAKELVSPEFLATRSQVGHVEPYLSSVLHLHWMLSYSEPRLGEWYDPATWQDSSKGKLAKNPLAKLFNDVEPHLAVLERFGIRQSRSRDKGTATSPDDVRAVALARLALNARVTGVCLGSNPTQLHSPGIDVAFSYSYVRTGFPDALLARIQVWLAGPLSSNLLASLAGVADADERHAALWLASDPEADSAREQGLGFLPTTGLHLPRPIDVLWVFVPPVVWRYDRSWTATLIKDESE